MLAGFRAQMVEVRQGQRRHDHSSTS
jgi:hypothetical protein